MNSRVYSLFNRSGNIEELKDSILQVGQIFFLNGYGQTEYNHERLAIYEIVNEENQRPKYKYVNLDKPGKGIRAAYEIKHISKLFGIGLYYKDGEIATQDEINQALEDANI